MKNMDKVYFEIKKAIENMSSFEARKIIRETATPTVLRRMEKSNAKWQAERKKIIPS